MQIILFMVFPLMMERDYISVTKRHIPFIFIKLYNQLWIIYIFGSLVTLIPF